MIYRFRVILDNDTEDDIFRDLEIRMSDTLEDLHNTITQAFGFDGAEMASFYISDEKWNQGEEISLFEMGENANEVMLMRDIKLEDILDKDKTRLIYIYDFFNMWTFFVELAEIVEEAAGTDYPNLMFAHGQIPEDAPEKLFEADDSYDISDDENGYDVDDYENLDFDENWN